MLLKSLIKYFLHCFQIFANLYLQAVKLTSVKTQLPYEYYALPFCQPQSGVVYKAENLGMCFLMRLLWEFVD